MKQKTAMIELIEWLNLNGMKPDVGIPDVKDKAKQLLEKEKYQISTAFNSGRYWNNSWDGDSYYDEIYSKEVENEAK